MTGALEEQLRKKHRDYLFIVDLASRIPSPPAPPNPGDLSYFYFPTCTHCGIVGCTRPCYCDECKKAAKLRNLRVAEWRRTSIAPCSSGA